MRHRARTLFLTDWSMLWEDVCFAVAAEVEVDYIPKPNYKRPPAVPVEEQRTGANKMSYFVKA